MSETTAIYNLSAELTAFAEPVRAALHLIQAKPEGEVTGALLRFVAATVHPDFVCNLADLGRLDIEVKQAVLELFEFCLTQGLTLDEKGAILRWITPYLQRQGALLASH